MNNELCQMLRYNGHYRSKSSACVSYLEFQKIIYSRQNNDYSFVSKWFTNDTVFIERDYILTQFGKSMTEVRGKLLV